MATALAYKSRRSNGLAAVKSVDASFEFRQSTLRRPKILLRGAFIRTDAPASIALPLSHTLSNGSAI